MYSVKKSEPKKKPLLETFKSKKQELIIVLSILVPLWVITLWYKFKHGNNRIAPMWFALNKIFILLLVNKIIIWVIGLIVYINFKICFGIKWGKI